MNRLEAFHAATVAMAKALDLEMAPDADGDGIIIFDTESGERLGFMRGAVVGWDGDPPKEKSAGKSRKSKSWGRKHRETIKENPPAGLLEETNSRLSEIVPASEVEMVGAVFRKGINRTAASI